MSLFETVKHVGFTGTQIGMLKKQREELETKLKELKRWMKDPDHEVLIESKPTNHVYWL